MTELKPEKSPPGTVFDGESESESQVAVNRPHLPSFRGLIRLFFSLAAGYCLILLHLWLNSTPELYFPKHGHHDPGKSAENIFLSIPNAKSAIHASRQYAGKPHLAGTSGDFATAELFLSTLQGSFGITPPEQKPVFDAGTHESQDATRGIVERDSPSAWIDTYYPVMNTPVELALQIVDGGGNVVWNADLKEHVPEGDSNDPDAVKYADEVPTFHGFSMNGDVTGHLIDGNYCSKDDYDKLVAQQAPLEGSIVLCRYNSDVRGLKVKGGQENGAVGVLIYSDPRDDGTITVENGYAPYPEGPARNPTSVQRGSVQFVSVYPGDPTTPGYPSYRNATRMEGTNIPSIPSLPISWNNAKQLLQVLQPGSRFEGKRVRLVNNVYTKVIPIWNVIGVIPGVIRNEVIVAGNHRDAWVLGAVDPSSGTVSMHEVIRGFGHLMKKGWKPLRTIVIASWDAEEYGLIGSTEWGEDFADWIDKHVVAYVNIDGAVGGSRFATWGSPLLAHFIRETARDVPHPTVANKSLWDARNDDGTLAQPGSLKKAGGAVEIAPVELEVPATMVDDLGITPLGSGSDYTVFLQRNGIPSTDEVFDSAPHDPIYHYHSIFDSVPWQERYGDPGFLRNVAITQHLGLQIMRLANAPLLPFNTTHYSLQLESYLDIVESLPESRALRLDLGPLRSIIHDLQKASLNLDREKYEAWDELRKVARRWWRHHKHHHGHPHHRRHRRRFEALRNIAGRVEACFGDPLYHDRQYRCPKQVIAAGVREFPVARLDYPRQTHTRTHLGEHEILKGSDLLTLQHPLAILYGLEPKFKDGGTGEDDHAHKHRDHGKGHQKWCKALLHALRRVHDANNRLRSFERGLISKDGIKDREWFKHLGVAPGKWLGYGATTFPGLTEVILFDKDKSAAEHEVKRLNNLVKNMVKKLRV